MRLGPGKHLKGRSIMGGIVKPEEYNYFHEVRSLDLPTVPFMPNMFSLAHRKHRAGTLWWPWVC